MLKERNILNTSAKDLKRRFVTAVLALCIALLAVTAATFAWYIYNTGAHTTNVHMATVQALLCRSAVRMTGITVPLPYWTRLQVH